MIESEKVIVLPHHFVGQGVLGIQDNKFRYSQLLIFNYLYHSLTLIF
jgi:hypothetical protein